MEVYSKVSGSLSSLSGSFCYAIGLLSDDLEADFLKLDCDLNDCLDPGSIPFAGSAS